jgi:hypothetical protein
MRQAADRFVADVRHDPTILSGEVRPRDVARASDHLEGTYVVRLFAEFETGLRSYWRAVRRTRPSAEVLIDRVSDLRRIRPGVSDHVHGVRDYLNQLVHEREGAGTRVPIALARRRLCMYFDRLPRVW